MTNDATGIEAVASGKSIAKMLSSSAFKKSESGQTHAFAVANIDFLFKTAIHGWSKPDRNSDSNIKAIHRFFSVLPTEDGPRFAKLTVKEIREFPASKNKIYSVEAVELSEASPASEWVSEVQQPEGSYLSRARHARDSLNVAETGENVKKDGQKGKLFSASEWIMKALEADDGLQLETTPNAKEIIQK